MACKSRCFRPCTLLLFFSSAKTADDLLYTLHSATTESTTCPECHRFRAKDCFCTSKVGLSKGGRGEQMAMDILDPLRNSRQQACSPTICSSVPDLWPSSFLLLWLPQVHKQRFTWTSVSSFFFCASAWHSLLLRLALMARRYLNR